MHEADRNTLVQERCVIHHVMPGYRLRAQGYEEQNPEGDAQRVVAQEAHQWPRIPRLIAYTSPATITARYSQNTTRTPVIRLAPRSPLAGAAERHPSASIRHTVGLAEEERLTAEIGDGGRRVETRTRPTFRSRNGTSRTAAAQGLPPWSRAICVRSSGLSCAQAAAPAPAP